MRHETEAKLRELKAKLKETNHPFTNKEALEVFDLLITVALGDEGTHQ